MGALELNYRLVAIIVSIGAVLNVYFFWGKLAPRIAPAVPSTLANALRPDGLRGCSTWYMRTPKRVEACYEKELYLVMHSRGTAALPELDRFANREQALGPACHGFMHVVGRKIALENPPSKLSSLFPKSAHVNCAAGFTHGILTAVGANQSIFGDIETVATICTRQPTRLRRMNCVHGLGHTFMRQTKEDVPRSLALCQRVVEPFESPDCAAGVFHDYGMALDGEDSASLAAGAEHRPQKLCETVPDRFVRACWYRLSQVEPKPTRPIILDTCGQYSAVQRSACISSVVSRSGEDDLSLSVCGSLALEDARSCIFGVYSVHEFKKPSFIRRCGDMEDPAIRRVCYERMAHVFAVFSDQRVEKICRKLDAADKAACLRGVRRRPESLGLI